MDTMSTRAWPQAAPYMPMGLVGAPVAPQAPVVSRFVQCVPITLRYEGGWSDDPHDPGGPTMKGITIAVYAGFLGVTLSPGNWEDMKARLRRIPDADVNAIYYRNYWLAVRADELPPGVDMAVFDFCVNSGPGQATRSLQRVLGGVKVDGHLGHATLAAVASQNPDRLIAALMNERRRFLRALKTFWRFGKGWLARCDAVEAAASTMVRKPLTLMPGEYHEVFGLLPQPLADPDQQSATQGRATPDAATGPWNTTVTMGATGSGGIAYEISQAFQRMQEFSPRGFFFALLSSPTFWMAAVTLGSAAAFYLWSRRRSVQ